MSYPYIERCVIHCEVKISELLDLRAFIPHPPDFDLKWDMTLIWCKNNRSQFSQLEGFFLDHFMFVIRLILDLFVFAVMGRMGICFTSVATWWWGEARCLLLCFPTGLAYCVALSAVLNFDYLGECSHWGNLYNEEHKISHTLVLKKTNDVCVKCRCFQWSVPFLTVKQKFDIRVGFVQKPLWHACFKSRPGCQWVSLKDMGVKSTCQGYHGYFRESHWKSMGLQEISRVTWQLYLCISRAKHTFALMKVIWLMWKRLVRSWRRKGPWHQWYLLLTHWGRDKTAAIFQTTFSNAFCWMNMYEFSFRFYWTLFLEFELTISQHWFR